MSDPIEQAIERYNSVLALPNAKMWAPECLKQLQQAVEAKYGAGSWERVVLPEFGPAFTAGSLLDPAKVRERLDGPQRDIAPSVPPAVQDSPAPLSPSHSTLQGLQAAPPAGVDGRKWLQRNDHLPLLDPSDEAAINKLDAGIESLNQRLFAVDPAKAWFPDGAQLPVTGANISTLGGTYNLAKDLIVRWRVAVDALLKAFEGTGEYLVEQQLARIRDPLKTLAAGAEASKDLHSLIARGGIAANDGFHQLRSEELGKRREITDISKELVRSQVNARTLNKIQITDEGLDRASATISRSHGEFTRIAAPNTVLRGADDANHLGEEIAALAGKIAAPVKVERETVGETAARAQGEHGSNRSAGSTTPAVGGGRIAATPGAMGKSNAAGSDLSKLLSALGQSGIAPPAQAMAAPAHAAQQAAQPLTQAAQQAAKVPEDLLKSLRGDALGNQRRLGPDTPAGRAADKDRTAATASTFTAPGPAASNGVGTPGSAARPHQLDATGRPADKDGNGRVDKDAVPLSKKTLRPFDLAVPVNGQHVEVKGVPDPRLGEMMLNIASAAGDKAVSVLEAAAAAGMDITSLGDPLDPSEVNIGSAVIGDEKSGMYLGDGRVLTSTGEVESLDDVLGKDGFVSKIPLPELPEDAPGAEPSHPGIPTPDSPAPAAGPAPAQAEDVTAPPPAAFPGPVTAPASPTPQPPTPGPIAPQDPVTAMGTGEITIPAASTAPEPPPPAAAGPVEIAYQGRALG